MVAKNYDDSALKGCGCLIITAVLVGIAFGVPLLIKLWKWAL